MRERAFTSESVRNVVSPENNQSHTMNRRFSGPLAVFLTH